MKKAKIYTRTGDCGTTSLVGGRRVAKCDDRLEAYGTLDELSASIGWLRTQLQSQPDSELLLAVQMRLFTACAFLATEPADSAIRAANQLTAADIERIEQRIDQLDAQVEPLRSFVIPGGSVGASAAHVTRTVCRRAERAICRVECDAEGEMVRRYINRLSDYLFVLARYENKMAKTDEIFWTKEL